MEQIAAVSSSSNIGRLLTWLMNAAGTYVLRFIVRPLCVVYVSSLRAMSPATRLNR